MKRILKLSALVVLIVIAGLAAIVAFNTFTSRSTQIAVTAIPRVPVDTDAAARRLAEAIRFRTISSYEKPDQDADALRGMQAHIAASFPAFHAATTRETVADFSLLYTWQGSWQGSSQGSGQGSDPQ